MIQILRGTDARLSASSAPTPKHGQPVYSTDTYNLKIGDGNHKFDELPTPNMIPSIKKITSLCII